MGKKGYNWKARQVVSTVIDDSKTKQIKLDLDIDGHYDVNNELVLPSSKRKTKVKKDKTQVTKLLSKQHRKRLEKVVEKKKKKENRAALLEALSSVKATPEELNSLTSIASVQTKGLKKYFQELNAPAKKTPKSDLALLSGDVKLNSLSGSKRKRLAALEQENFVKKSSDPNVVGFDNSSSDDDSEADDDTDKSVEEKRIKLGEKDDEIKEEEVEVKEESDVKLKEESDVETKEDEVFEIPEENEGDLEENQKTNSDLNKVERCSKLETTKNETRENVKEAQKSKTPVERKPAIYVDVHRTEEIQKARLKLPILAEEQQIMEIIGENAVILLAGETGSGKTTQVPQFLFEAGYARERMIAVTEPRRVAAISMSKRVGEEMNLSSKEISYLIRFEGNVTDETKIKFMTDGVLLKEIKSDFLLSKYSVVILDEAHERSVYTDILIGLLSRVVPMRKKRGDPLKLIIMSATLRLEDFTENRRLFKIPPPVVKVEARQFPVTIHFNKRTVNNYLKEAYKKAVKVHTKLPEGGILIFVTGQQEVKSLVNKLRKSFPLRNKKLAVKARDENGFEDEDEEIEEQMKKALKKKKKVAVIPTINLDDYSIPGDNEDLDLSEDENDLDLNDSDPDDDLDVTNAQPMWVLPLYSLLPSEKQTEVFKPPPPGCRFCVISTNVAETSLTIPNVKYVIDTGKTKVKLYDKTTGVSSYMVTWTSKASADQRAGRAGRTGPGHCYRLYSSAVFNDVFTQYDVPEIQRKPVDDLYLQMKCMGIDKVANFPFPTAPDLLQLKSAESRLEILGALKEKSVTPLGRAISKFPVLPRFGKMLALSHQQELLPYTICMVAALSVQEVLLEVPIGHASIEEVKKIREKWGILRKQWAGHGNSLLLGDPMVLLRAVGAAEYANSEGKLEKFCGENGLRHKAVTEIRKLRIQLTSEIKSNIPEADVIVDPKLAPPSDLQAKLLRQILLSGMGDQVAKKVMPDELKENEEKAKFKYAYKANNMEDPVFLHQGSVLKKTLPEFVVYQEIYETNKMYMRGVTVIEPEWLVKYVPHLCNLNEPLMDPEPRYDSNSGKIYCTVNGTFGSQAWPLPNTEIEYPKTVDVYKWFARFLLEGRIFKQLEQYKSSLLTVPSTMVKSWAKLQKRTEVILKVLMGTDCKSKDDLEEQWSDNSKFLLHEYLQWLPESAHTEVTLMWPPKF